MKLIGLIGLPGAGRTTASKFLRTNGFMLIRSDTIRNLTRWNHLNGHIHMTYQCTFEQILDNADRNVVIPYCLENDIQFIQNRGGIIVHISRFGFDHNQKIFSDIDIENNDTIAALYDKLAKLC